MSIQLQEPIGELEEVEVRLAPSPHSAESASASWHLHYVAVLVDGLQDHAGADLHLAFHARA